jgi:hypothetical protein
VSRSYNRFPATKDHATRWVKRQASKAVRRHKGEIPSGGWYKRLYDSWIICDYCIYSPRNARPDLTDAQWAKFHRWK